MKSRIRIMSILKARCPSCHTGKILDGVFAIRSHCPECKYNCNPEPGFYLGAMVIGFLLTAVLTVPPLIILKILDVDIWILLAAPFAEFLFVGSFLLFYSRILWLHLEYSLTDHLDGHEKVE